MVDNPSSILSCFKAYDIRGRVPHELTLEAVRQIGIAFVAEFSLKSVCIGYDVRLSSKDITLVLINALEDAGANVTVLGLCGTEEVYYATFSQGFDGGIMVTASHNAADWNGLKLLLRGALPVAKDTGLKNIANRTLTGDLPIAIKQGYTKHKSFRNEYISHLLSCLPHKDSLTSLRIVANAGNGCAGPVIQQLSQHLPCECLPLHAEPDGLFPNGVPNPLLPENRESTGMAIRQLEADFGVAWDADFDRCFFFDANGRFIESYYIVGLLAEHLLRDNPNEGIVHDPRLVWSTQEIVKKNKGTPIECRSGHSFIKDCLRKENSLYGGEMSGHHYFRSFSFCDSGMLAWLKVYEILSVTGKSLAELVDIQMQRYPVSGERNFILRNPDTCIQTILEMYADKALHISKVDGISLEFANWRCNIRKSNTEPKVRLNVESRGDIKLLQQKTNELSAILKYG